jgi:hypothetical protein
MYKCNTPMLSARKHTAENVSMRGNTDIRTFMRQNANSALVVSSLDNKVVDVKDSNVVAINDITEQNCSNCKTRRVGNEVKKCGFNDWCDVCDESLWASNPDVICTGVSTTLLLPSAVSLLSSSAVPRPVSHKRNHVIHSDDNVSEPARKRTCKKKINDGSSDSDSFTSHPADRYRRVSGKKLIRKRRQCSAVILYNLLLVA